MSDFPGQEAIYNKKFLGNLHRHDNRLQICNICSCSGRRRTIRDRGGSSVSWGRYRDGVGIDRVRWMSIMVGIQPTGIGKRAEPQPGGSRAAARGGQSRSPGRAELQPEERTAAGSAGNG